MFTAVIFLAVISVLVFVHELGHFWAAKRAGMTVQEFGFGFPPRLWGRRYRGTLYSINAVPFGGFVRIFGEQGEHRVDPGSFGRGTFGQKITVIAAGVAMNFLFAAVLLMAGNFLGLRVGLFDASTSARAVDRRVQIIQVAQDSPAQLAGLRELDEIRGFRRAGSAIYMETAAEIQQYAFAHTGQEVTMLIRRGTTELDVPVHTRQTSPTGQGPIGISLVLTGEVRFPWYESIWRGILSAAELFWMTLTGYIGIIGSLFRSGYLAADVSGPIGIAALTGQAARVGFNYLLQFVAMISINLAVLNILPFPALDGGRLVMVVAEKLRGKSLSHSVEDSINGVGFIILIALMVAVTVKDIVKFF